MLEILNYVGGTLQKSLSELYFDNIEPATGRVFARVARSNAQDVDVAVKFAQKATAQWQGIGTEGRARILLKIADLIEQNVEMLAQAESQDTGKPLWLARQMDIPRSWQNLRFYATAALHWSNESYEQVASLNYTLRQPLGVVGCISPWNLPLYLFTWKIAPALAAGNCVIAKPSELSPYTAFLFSQLCMEAGLPAGVLNVLHGYGAEVGEAIVAHPQVKAISFTGGTQTGARIAETASKYFKKISLELGGKNPTIVFKSASYQEALHTALRAAFLNQGEICLCGSRIFVEKSIYEQFKRDFLQEVSKLKVGNPKDENTFIGALISQKHLQKVLSYVELAQQEGGKILIGGRQKFLTDENAGGFFMEPTVIEGLSVYCRTNQEEIFGPVVTLTSFESEDEVVEYANSVPYGLACSIWTQDLSQAHRVAHKIQAGIVWVNCWLLRDLRTPFGGMKHSGIGREGGFEALNFFTETKNVCIKI